MAGAGKGNYLLITLAAMNMIISFYYYLRIVKAIFMDSNESPIERLMTPVFPKLALFICMAGIIATGVLGFLFDYVHDLAGTVGIKN